MRSERSDFSQSTYDDHHIGDPFVLAFSTTSCASTASMKQYLCFIEDPAGKEWLSQSTVRR